MKDLKREFLNPKSKVPSSPRKHNVLSHTISKSSNLTENVLLGIDETAIHTSQEGIIAAQVFELLNKGADPSTLVIRLKLEPEIFQKYREHFFESEVTTMFSL